MENYYASTTYADLSADVIQAMKLIDEYRYNHPFSHSTKQGCNAKAIAKRRKKNKNKKTHRK